MDKIIDLDLLLGPAPDDSNQEQAEYEAMKRHNTLWMYGSKSRYSKLASEISPSERDKHTWQNFIEGLYKMR